MEPGLGVLGDQIQWVPAGLLVLLGFQEGEGLGGLATVETIDPVLALGLLGLPGLIVPAVNAGPLGLGGRPNKLHLGQRPKNLPIVGA